MGNGEVGFSKFSAGVQTFLAVLMIIGAVVPCVLGFVNLDKRVDDVEGGQLRSDIINEKFRVQYDEKIHVLQKDSQTAALERQKLETTLQYLRESNIRIELWIRQIDEINRENNNASSHK